MVKSTGHPTPGLKSGMADGNIPCGRDWGRRDRSGLESGISVWIGGVFGVCGASWGS